VTSTPVSEPFPRRRGTALPSRASALFLGLGALAVGFYFLLPADAQEVWYVVIGAASVGALAEGTRRLERSRAAWTFFTLGVGSAVVADAISGWYELHLGKEPPTPSVVDVFYLAGYPLMLTGVVLLLRELGAVRSRVALLDALIIAVAAGTVQWVFFFDPAVHSSLKPLARVVALGYPTMDLFMLVALVQLLLATGGRVVAYRLLVASMALWVIGDEIYGLSIDNYVAGGWVDAFWLLAYVLWGAAALDPSAGRPPARDRREVPRLTVDRLVLLACALLTIPAIVLVEHLWPGHSAHPVAIVAGASALAVLVLVRFAGLISAVETARRAERRANVRLRELDRLKDEFIATVSHELRTPLTSISGYIELAREQAEPELRGYLEIAERNTLRLLALVNDLLLVARIKSGHLELEPGEVEVGDLVTEYVASAEPDGAAGNVALRTHLPEGGLAVRADRRRLGQVLDNLISNAIKFSPDGGAVDVTVAVHEGAVRIEVADVGIGIAEEEQAQLFERFFRAQSALDRQIPGTGLGLYICKAIVDAHGGTITVRSAVGEGSSFAVDLPPSTAELG